MQGLARGTVRDDAHVGEEIRSARSAGEISRGSAFGGEVEEQGTPFLGGQGAGEYNK